MKNELFYNFILGNAFDEIKKLSDNSIDLVITDPPYFIDGMGEDWDKKTLTKKTKKAKVIGSMPVGMKFDVEQGIKFQQFMEEISKEIYRVIKPGGFYFSFSQARLYHRLGIAIENSNFEIRDMICWVHEGQPKAFSMDHFVRKMKISENEKKEIIKELEGRKTPQLRPRVEPIVLAQKPKEGTFIQNWLKFKTGLINTSVLIDGLFPSNVMEIQRPSKKEKGEDNTHLTVKPIEIIENIINIFSKEGQIVLDPFFGSGTTGIACFNTKRNFIGFEIEEEYLNISKGRFESVYNGRK